MIDSDRFIILKNRAAQADASDLQREIRSFNNSRGGFRTQGINSSLVLKAQTVLDRSVRAINPYEKTLLELVYINLYY